MPKLKQPAKPVKHLVEKREYIELPGSDCTLRAWVLAFELLIQRYGKDARIEQDAGYESIIDRIVYKVKETDVEFEKRLKIEAKKAAIDAEKKREAELEEYKRLKRKFE